MSAIPYKIQHWSRTQAVSDFRNHEPFLVTVNDRAATRMAIISAVRRAGCTFVDRMHWGAAPYKRSEFADDWDYTMIAIHHAGRSYLCGTGMTQMHSVQQLHREKNNELVVGYHFAIDCQGAVYEGRDIRSKGAHLHRFNTGAIGIVILQNLSEPEDSDKFPAQELTVAKSLGVTLNVDIRETQKHAIKCLITQLRGAFKIAQLGGHKEFPMQADTHDGKICPGTHGMEFVHELREWSGLAGPTINNGPP